MNKVKKIKLLSGIAISNSKDKTVVVEVSRTKKHPKYLKRYTTSKKYLVHSEKDVAVGEKVNIQEVRPISKNKTWKII